ncbi:uncharacterized protein FIBRA_04327 [Fibroporia radiculosa]|uniref:Major facilitator superfamily (MFS) profile domain-containing protein n=1 Tax=Fibroporia radiculosa TaxID=599839 RepID=J4IA40_9APHY|nr:uncharacterized protein FIBRA_04327 [Fibroporia radiculosa]CCM02246.1 predicted protein [Fibroporia radiculosa]
MASDSLQPPPIAYSPATPGKLEEDDSSLSVRSDGQASPPDVLAVLPAGRKALLLSMFCFALFLDSFNNSSLFVAIPPIAAQLDIPNSQSVWLLSSYQLTFAALLLISGRVSDIYSAKWVFVIGIVIMGVFSLVGGFMRHEIPLIVCRALMGAGAALTIPSALHLIVHMYPDPAEQAKAIAMFGGMGGIGIALGLIIGALLVTYTSWPWVFYFSAIISGFIAFWIVLFVPNSLRPSDGMHAESRVSKMLKFKRLDLFGVVLFAAVLILFIFAVTSGANDGWKSARVIAPLIISAVLFAFFFIWESRLPEDYAALLLHSPPKMWKYENFTILIAISVVPCMWWAAIMLLFSWYWETVYGWSAIITALHFLPIALGIFPAVPVAATLQSKMRLKWVLLIGFVLITAGTILLPFANSKEHYWPLAFPGFLIGTAGAAMLYATLNIAVLAITPPAVSGIVSAVFNSALQTGVATGVAIVTSIQTSVQISHGGPEAFTGRAAGLWFLVAFIGTMMLLFLVLMKDTIGPVDPNAPPGTANASDSGKARDSR